MSTKAKNLKIPQIFSSHMVLQRDIPIRIWGWTVPGKTVTVSFLEQEKKTKAGKKGRWKLKLKPVSGGGPYRMTVSSGNEQIILNDILVGEVWICSGQSNMNFSLSGADTAEEDIPKANHPKMRWFDVIHYKTGKKQDDVVGTWKKLTPETAPHLTAVGYYFGRKLHQELDVPVGLIHDAWGGSSIEPWMSPKALKSKKAFAPVLKRAEELKKTYPEKMREWGQRYTAWLKENKGVVKTDPSKKGIKDGWHLPGLSSAGWKNAKRVFVKPGEMKEDGVVWYRKTLSIPKGWVGKNLKVDLGVIDAQDDVYINGELLGSNRIFTTPLFWLRERVHSVPAEMVTSEEITIAVRMLLQNCTGSPYGDVSTLDISCGKEHLPIGEKWKYRIAAEYKPNDPSKFRTPSPWPIPDMPWSFHQPSLIYNAMIHPITGFGVKGAIWYQGESNCERGHQYRKLLTALIDDWRRLWKQKEFYFGIVQLANVGEPLKKPVDTPIAELRESQYLAYKDREDTGIVTAVDIGQWNDIHPTNKKDVGLRLADWALNDAYGLKNLWSGPQLRKAEKTGNAVEITFSCVGEGLRTADGKAPRAFLLAGDDGQWKRAQARITDEDTVTVRSSSARKPEFVRYAWEPDPKVNLVNSKGLPAFPFRTDHFPGITYGRK